ncbi:MAG TPA: hypothetical protein PLF42_16830 [Anaerolineales bacterium]|nr:hypothetical protein [Anaerolineales bacterium]
MDTIVLAFGPAFAAGFALQKLLEILDPLIERLVKGDEKAKKLFLGLVSLAAGLVLAFGAGIRVLVHLGYMGHDLWDAGITALIVSAGTEGINSIMKYLGYAKENKKEEVGIRVAVREEREEEG